MVITFKITIGGMRKALGLTKPVELAVGYEALTVF